MSDDACQENRWSGGKGTSKGWFPARRVPRKAFIHGLNVSEEEAEPREFLRVFIDRRVLLVILGGGGSWLEEVTEEKQDSDWSSK